MKVSPWITLPALALLTMAPAGAQTADPAPAKTPAGQAKPPVHKPEQSALNRAKQDERAKKALEESSAILKESIRKEQAAAKEGQRLNADQIKDDPEKALQTLKDKISPEDTAALKEDLKKTAKKVLDSDEAKKLIEEAKKKGASAVEDSKKSKPGNPPAQPGAPLPPPTTFDKIPGPTPVAATALPAPEKRKVKTVVNGDEIILPPSSDPKHPGQALRPDSALARTYVISGNAQIKMEVMMVDADHIVCLKNAESASQGLGGLGAAPAPSAAPAPVAPDKTKDGAASPDAKKDDDSGIESMVATGSVRVVRYDKEKVYHGKGNRMVYDQKGGTTTITGWPTVQQGNQIITAKQENSTIILPSNGGSPKFTDCTVKTVDDKKTAQAPATPGAASPADTPAASAAPASDSKAAGTAAPASTKPRAATTPTPPAAGSSRRSAAPPR